MALPWQPSLPRHQSKVIFMTNSRARVARQGVAFQVSKSLWSGAWPVSSEYPVRGVFAKMTRSWDFN